MMNMCRKLFLTAMLLTFVLTMMAQITNSALSGKVSMEDTKEEVIGATVVAVHDPSGTRYAAITNIDGRFNIQGMRNGGPYTITVSYIGYETKTYKDIVLQLGETYNLNVWLSENANEIAEVVVSGKASKFASEKPVLRPMSATAPFRSCLPSAGLSTILPGCHLTMAVPTVSEAVADVSRILRSTVPT